MPTHIFTDEEKEALREQMLEAGFPLLKQYGMTHTSVAKITAGLLSYLEHVRADVNLGLVANLCKVLIITVESRAELHEAVYEETLRVQIETILDLIFEA